MNRYTIPILEVLDTVQKEPLFYNCFLSEFDYSHLLCEGDDTLYFKIIKLQNLMESVLKVLNHHLNMWSFE